MNTEHMEADLKYTEKIVVGLLSALSCIANMQITEHTDKGEVLALCMSIARIELEKNKTNENA